MDEFRNRKVVVIGLDPSGTAACELLKGAGAKVFGVAVRSENPSQKQTPEDDRSGVKIISEKAVPGDVDFIIHSSQVSAQYPFVASLAARGIPVLSDLELAARSLLCLSVAITGTNGKTTTA